jgi:hypothetical protein
MGFEDAINRLKKQTEACDLNILVWGPGRDAGEHFEKRLKMKQEISKSFRNADIRFSEDLEMDAVLPGIGRLGFPDQELWHLSACDMCIVLDTSVGAGEEIAHYVGTNHAYKLLILTHEKYENSTSFPRSLRKHQNQLFYNDQEYLTCRLVEQVLTRINTVALGKLSGIKV